MQRIRVSVISLGERHSLVKLTPRVAVITQALKRAGKGGRMARCVAGYFGFGSFDEAQALAGSVAGRFPKARIQVRSGKRLAATFEVKVGHECAEQLAWQMAQRASTTGQRIERHLKAVSSRPSVAPDSPSDRWANAPMLNRGSGRKTLTGRAGLTVGLE